MPITRPQTKEYKEYFHRYIAKVPQNDLAEALNVSSAAVDSFFKAIPAEKHHYRYAEGKWTVAGVLAHIIDCERVFAYRAMSISRNDKTSFPGFDEDEYGKYCNADNRTLESLLNEYQHLRKANIRMFENMTEEMWMRRGLANNNEITVRALGYILPGHETHHMEVIKERYL